MLLFYVFAVFCMLLSAGCLFVLYRERENRHLFREEINGRLEAWKSDIYLKALERDQKLAETISILDNGITLLSNLQENLINRIDRLERICYASWEKNDAIVTYTDDSSFVIKTSDETEE